MAPEMNERFFPDRCAVEAGIHAIRAWSFCGTLSAVDTLASDAMFDGRGQRD
jgi:hypothetical protein